ncbi:hypothetical protein NDU88_000238 [Pleurodeles waltl]|uniref:Uncharacterized protein n=1 Tax=Pleurodeles waltl TaxID=8319 RepID=A0AAV7UR30_PLEWA|nr:hypothetical protein NDU88_000238 [Pleurodeles waltl]
MCAGRSSLLAGGLRNTTFFELSEGAGALPVCLQTVGSLCAQPVSQWGLRSAPDMSHPSYPRATGSVRGNQQQLSHVTEQ